MSAGRPSRCRWPGSRRDDVGSVDRDVHVVVVVRRGGPAVLHELPGRTWLPVALLPDDVLHVVGPGVGLDERRDGVTGRPVSHEVDGLARAVLAGVRAVAADRVDADGSLDGRAEAENV